MEIVTLKMSSTRQKSPQQPQRTPTLDFVTLFLKATLPKILISNFHPEIDFAHNSSSNLTWQVGNKYEIISEKLKFFKIF